MANDSNPNLQSDEILSLTNSAFASYLIVTSLLILKMMLVTLLTIMHRFKNKVFISDEDVVLSKNGGEVGSHPDVDRARRAYQNDLENIPLFIVIGLCYLWTRPPLGLAHTVFYVFLLARVLHTFVYTIYVVRQPSRAIFFMIGFILLGYMCVHTALYAFIVGYLGTK